MRSGAHSPHCRADHDPQVQVAQRKCQDKHREKEQNRMDNEGKSRRHVTRAEVGKDRPNQRVKKATVISPNQEQPSLPVVSSRLFFRWLRKSFRDGKVIGWLKAGSALTEDSGFIPSTYVGCLTTACNPSSRGSDISGLCKHLIQGMYSHTHTHIYL